MPQAIFVCQKKCWPKGTLWGIDVFLMEIVTINLLSLFTVNVVSLFGKRVAPFPSLPFTLTFASTMPLLWLFWCAARAISKTKSSARTGAPLQKASCDCAAARAAARTAAFRLASSSKFIVWTYFLLRVTGVSRSSGHLFRENIRVGEKIMTLYKCRHKVLERHV